MQNKSLTSASKFALLQNMKLNTTKIKNELERIGHTQSWLADKMNISRQLLSYMVRSKKITHAERIGKALGIEPKDLII